VSGAAGAAGATNRGTHHRANLAAVELSASGSDVSVVLHLDKKDTTRLGAGSTIKENPAWASQKGYRLDHVLNVVHTEQVSEQAARREAVNVWRNEDQHRAATTGRILL